MFLRIFLLTLIFLSPSVFSEGFSFSYGFKKYDINLQDDLILFNTKDMALSLANKSCFAERFKGFHQSLKQVSSGVTLKKFEEGDALKFQWKGQTYGTEENSVFGQRLLALPRDMIKMKLIEKDLCQKKKSNTTKVKK